MPDVTHAYEVQDLHGYKSPVPLYGAEEDRLNGSLEAWELKAYSDVTGMDMPAILEDLATVYFALIPRQYRGYALEWLHWMAPMVDDYEPQNG